MFVIGSAPGKCLLLQPYSVPSHVQLFRTVDGALACTLDTPGGKRERRPCTALCFRPSSGAELTKNVLLTGGGAAKRSQLGLQTEWKLYQGVLTFASCGHQLILIICFPRTRDSLQPSRGRPGLGADAHGDLRHWHATSGACLSSLHEEGNQVLSVAYRADGQLFASAGLDCAVRVYSETSRTLLHTLTQG